MLAGMIFLCCLCGWIKLCIDLQKDEETKEDSTQQNQELEQVIVDNPREDFPFYWNGEAWIPVPKHS